MNQQLRRWPKPCAITQSRTHYDALANLLAIAAPGHERQTGRGSCLPRKQFDRTDHAKQPTSVATQSALYHAGDLPYDAHGNMLSMPHLAHLEWDFKDERALSI